MSFGTPLGLAITRSEAIGFGVSGQVVQQHGLGLGADGDDALAAVMLRLVRCGTVEPNIAAAVKVAGPRDADLCRPHSGEPLESHHVGHDGR
jgi:hypothetical protein